MPSEATVNRVDAEPEEANVAVAPLLSAEPVGLTVTRQWSWQIFVTIAAVAALPCLALIDRVTALQIPFVADVLDVLDKTASQFGMFVAIATCLLTTGVCSWARRKPARRLNLRRPVIAGLIVGLSVAVGGAALWAIERDKASFAIGIILIGGCVVAVIRLRGLRWRLVGNAMIALLAFGAGLAFQLGTHLGELATKGTQSTSTGPAEANSSPPSSKQDLNVYVTDPANGTNSGHIEDIRGRFRPPFPDDAEIWIFFRKQGEDKWYANGPATLNPAGGFSVRGAWVGDQDDVGWYVGLPVIVSGNVGQEIAEMPSKVLDKLPEMLDEGQEFKIKR